VVLWCLSLWVRSWRFCWEGPPLPSVCVIALWHQDLPACLGAFRFRDISVLISQSRDGGLFAELARLLGYRVFRGSSSRGQEATRHLLRALRRGYSTGMALDGPRGPALLEKPGSQWLARQAGVPLAYVKVRYTHALRLRSWDRTCIPWPASRIYMSVCLDAPSTSG